MDILLLITTPTNIRYLTGFVGVEARDREAYVLLIRNQLFLFTNALYLESAKQFSNSQIIQFSNNPIKIVEISREKPFSKKLKDVLDSARTRKLGFEEADLTVAEYNKLKQELKGITLVPTKNRIEELRMIKRKDEIANIKKAAKLTDQCFDFILRKLKPGIMESEVAWEIEKFFRERGAQIAFSPIVAFGTNSSQPHYNLGFTRPRLETETRQGEALKTQDIVLLDFGARVDGYCADMTRVVFIGKPRDERKRTYQVVLAAQQAVLDKLSHILIYEKKTEKVSGAALDRIARQVIKKAGLPPYPHSLGHAVGLDIHESPRLTIKKDQKLKPNMVVTVEPAVYVEGRYGIRIEDLVLLKNDTIEILTKSQKALTIL